MGAIGTGSGQREGTGRLVNRKGLFPERPGLRPPRLWRLAPDLSTLFTTVTCTAPIDQNSLPQGANTLRRSCSMWPRSCIAHLRLRSDFADAIGGWYSGRGRRASRAILIQPDAKADSSGSCHSEGRLVSAFPRADKNWPPPKST